jgi:hypothetical protein
MALIPLKYTYVGNSMTGYVRSTKRSVLVAKYSQSQVPESGVAIDVDGLCFSYSSGRQVGPTESAIHDQSMTISYVM